MENKAIDTQKLDELIDKKSIIGEILKSQDLLGTFGLAEFLDTEDLRYFDSLDIFKKDDSIYINCPITKKARIVKSTKVNHPEEIIRQLYLIKLMKHYGYPISRIDIERPVTFGREKAKRDDIVVYRTDSKEEEYIIVEVKKPDVKEGIDQLKCYANATGAPLLVLTDGKVTTVLQRTDPNIFESLPDLPRADQKAEDLKDEKLTFYDLESPHNLQQIIKDIEDTILAHSGVNSFDEIFKLIYAKLYDEIYTPKSDNRMFKVTTASNQEHLDKIKHLFSKAKKQWGEGVFDEFEEIKIPTNTIVSAISLLQKYKLYNGENNVIDDAFEYLITSDSKGDKGQYFTPRWVVDMAVRMLNPKTDEYVIDTAAGSCGFPLHAMKYVWDKEITEEKYGPEYIDMRRRYAQDHLYAMDFDPRAVKVAKAVMLIAGDGKTNVVNANTLDSSVWGDEVKSVLNNRLLSFKDFAENEANKKQFSHFDFDILITNPPFAGDNKGSLLTKYELGKNARGKLQNSVSRDILFIERNLNFLKPGGRMAIVLPQGILNNSSAEYIRQYFMRQARVLAIVSLGVNTFKPHTGTKTSVIFLQKWGGAAGEPQPDYPIFMAVSKRPGRDNSGRKVYKKDSNGQYIMSGNSLPMIDTDLDDIADAFVSWGKEQKFSFL